MVLDVIQNALMEGRVTMGRSASAQWNFMETDASTEEVAGCLLLIPRNQTQSKKEIHYLIV